MGFIEGLLKAKAAGKITVEDTVEMYLEFSHQYPIPFQDHPGWFLWQEVIMGMGRIASDG